MKPNRPPRRTPRWTLAVAALAFGTSPASGVTQLRRGDVPPPIHATTLDEQPFSLEQHRGSVVLLMFGELYHARTLEACRVLGAVLAEPRVAEARPVCVLIAAQQTERASLRAAVHGQGLSLDVLHDRDRAVFSAYHVSVLPSVVVLDRAGRVAHAAAGLGPAFRDVTTDAILLAAGTLDPAAFERTLRPASGPAESESGRRAARLTELGRQLSRSGMHDLAADKYREALAAEPSYTAARLALGRLAQQRRQLAEAETQFRAALAAEPGSADGLRGLAWVQALRGGAELPAAEQQVRALLAKRPHDAEAHYLLGLIHEQSGRAKEAAASFRRSAELLFEQGGGR